MSNFGLVGLAPLFFVLGLGGAAGAAGPGDPTHHGDEVKVRAPAPRTKGTEALAGAAKLKREASGKKGEEKLEALVRAARGYERVARDLADEKAAAAEASFRAGEIWRTMKHAEDARRCFEAAAAESTEAPGFAARAWLELGHLDRHQKRLDEAQRCYERVLAIVPAQRRECARALTWQGKVLIDQKNEKDGHAVLLSVGERFPEFPLDDVRNVDLVAVDWIRAGRVAEARSLVNDCVERHSEPDDDESDVEPSIRRALERMKSRELLQDTAESK